MSRYIFYFGIKLLNMVSLFGPETPKQVLRQTVRFQMKCEFFFLRSALIATLKKKSIRSKRNKKMKIIICDPTTYTLDQPDFFCMKLYWKIR